VSFTGTHEGVSLVWRPIGREIHAEGIVILGIAGGRIVEEWVTENLLGLLQQLSTLPILSVAAGPHLAQHALTAVDGDGGRP